MDLSDNQIEIMDISGSNLVSLQRFSIKNNPITEVCLADATLNQTNFIAIMSGNPSSYAIDYTGIAELGGVLSLDMSGVDFADISDFSAMYAMDDLETLLLAQLNKH